MIIYDNLKISDIQNSVGEDYISFRKKLIIKPVILAFDAFLPWFMIIISILFLDQIENKQLNIILIPISALWFAFWVKAYSLLFHEAAHNNIHTNKKINDIIANVFFTPFFGMWVNQYREHHWQHHLHLGKFEDTEVSYHSPINFFQIIHDLTGIYVLKKVVEYFIYFNKETKNLKRSRNILLFVSSIFYMIFMQIIIILIFYNFFSIFLAIAWFVGFFFISTFLEKIRQTCEHRSLNATKEINYKKIEHGPVNRIFGSDFFSRYFGAAGFNKHLLHHIDPSISYTAFRDMESFMVNSNASHLVQKNQLSYFQTIKSLFNK